MNFFNLAIYPQDWMDWITLHLMGIFIGVGIYVLISFILGIIVYNDAQNNNISGAGAWFIITFLFNIVGVIFYVIVREPRSVQKESPIRTSNRDFRVSVEPITPSTGTPELISSPDATLYCPYCGVKLTSDVVFCPNCGASVQWKKFYLCYFSFSCYIYRYNGI